MTEGNCLNISVIYVFINAQIYLVLYNLINKLTRDVMKKIKSIFSETKKKILAHDQYNPLIHENISA